jgi:hypothetical protein
LTWSLIRMKHLSYPKTARNPTEKIPPPLFYLYAR